MSEEQVQPTDFKARSFHYRTLQADGASFAAHSGSAIAAAYGGSVEDERAQALTMGLADLSPLARTGFKGKQALSWLNQAGIHIGETNNFAWNQEDGSTIARLADTEALILSDITGKSNLCSDLEARLSAEQPEQCYQVPRRDASAWFLVTGDRADMMFAKICGVDMRQSKFATGEIAQTSMARMNAIAIRNDINDVPAYHLVFDSASADYLWRMLKDAMSEFNGKPIGYKAVLSLAQSS